MSLRMKKNASQVEVSKAVGLSRIHYGNVEKGLHTAKTELAEEIAKYFKSPIATIFKKVDDVHYLVKK
jgi:DNA-binding XRE family transcriptional regulator